MKSRKRQKIIIIVLVLILILTVSFYKSGLGKLIENNPNHYSSRGLQKLMDKDSQIRSEVLFLQNYHNTSMENIELRDNNYILEKDGVISRDSIQKEMQGIND